MSAIANITVFDGAATPVSHTLVAQSVNTEKGVTIAEWREQIATLPLEAQVSCTLTKKVLPSGVAQVTARVSVPVMESVSGNNAAGYTAAPKVAYVDSYTLTGYMHPRSTITSRRLARQIMANLLNNVSTTVAAATTGPLPEAFDAQSMPV